MASRAIDIVEKINTKIPALIFALMVCLAYTGRAEDRSTAVAIVASSIESVNVPILGTGHFLHGNWQTGTAFALGEGITYFYATRRFNPVRDTTAYPCASTSHILYHKHTRGLSPSQFAKVALRGFSSQSFRCLRFADEFLTYRGYRKDEVHALPLTRKSFWELSASPFKWKYLREPEVFGPILISGVVSLFGKNSVPSLVNAKSVNWFGRDVSPLKVTLGNTFLEWVGFTLVAVGEEMFYRGVIQTELSELINPDFGWIASSLLFGLAHVPGRGWRNFLPALAGGFYLGWQYKKYDHDLGRVIALHFHLDFVPMAIEFLRNPLTGRGVYSVRF